MKVKALLTGHSTGLGLGIAHALCNRGVSVLAVSRRPATSLSNQKNGGLLQSQACLQECSLDLSDLNALEAWLQSQQFLEWWGDAAQALLINNAGVVTPVAPLGSQGAGQIAKAVGLNVAAPLMMADAFIRATQGIADRRVLHVSSGAGRQAYAGWGVYCASKAALDHHARATALDQVSGLKIVSLAPGVIDTDMQGAIRESEEGLFPNRQRFVELKQNGQLTDPLLAGESVSTYLLSDRFGQEVVADVRQR